MHSDKKTFETYLYSFVGVVGMLAVLIVINVLFGSCNARLDLTEERLFTLSPSSRSILAELDTPVTIRFYFSKDVQQMPPVIRTYAERVQDLLKEYRQNSGGHIEIVKLNPAPDSDAEDSANLDGVTGRPLGPLGTGDMLYLGLAVSCLDETVALPFLSPEREAMLEYDITRAVYRAVRPEKVKIGVMSSLPVMGSSLPPQMMMQMPNMNQQPPWQVIAELRRDAEVVEVQADTDRIDDDLKVLVLIHPKDLKDKSLYAIDQFVLRGGKVLAFLDPMSMVESQNQQQPMQFMPPGASTLGRLLDTWGIAFDTEKVVADLRYMARIRRRADAPPESMPLVLNLTSEAIDPNDPATGQLTNLLFVYGGTFSGSGAAGLTKTVLLRTSDSVQTVEKFMAQGPGDRLVRDFRSLEVPQDLAIRLVGRFRSAFPDGKPADEGAEAADPAAGNHLAEGTADSAVILVADSDMIYDHFCVQRGNFLGASFVQPINDNLAMVQNLVEQLAGDTRLIAIRSRGTVNRPLEAIARLQVRAEQQWQAQIRSLEDELQEARRKIGELQREKGADGDRAFVSKETQEAIRRFRLKEAETNQQLKLVRRNLRRDIDFLENSVTWLNILVMPILVALGGLGLAFIKRQRMVRK